VASLVFGTRTADTKNDSVINVSAISEALKPTPRLLDLRAGLLERINWYGIVEESSRLGRFAATGPPHRETPPGNGSEVPRGARRGRARPLYGTDSN
jgi:hypothetical protein